MSPPFHTDLNSPDLREDMEPPPRLYHYTNAAGFLEIVRSGRRLHATQHQYLNDRGEVSFGFEVALDVLMHMEDELPPEVNRQTKAKIEEFRNKDLFLACLSERHDVLSQWRAYADDGKGYCIGFRPLSRLDGYGDEETFWSSRLLQCMYGRQALEDRLKDRFRRKLERYKNATCEGRDEALVSQLSRLILRYASLAKHGHFEEEREWRLIVDAPEEDIQYRVGARGLTPFLPSNELALETVWIGRSGDVNPVIAKRTVTQFLNRHGISAEVEYWESPFSGR
jgi:DUF2971 family protein